MASIERDEMRHRGVEERRARGLDIEPSVANSGANIQIEVRGISPERASMHARTARDSVTLSNNLLDMSSLRSSRAKATFALVFAFSAFCLSQAAPVDVFLTESNAAVDGWEHAYSDKALG